MTMASTQRTRPRPRVFHQGGLAGTLGADRDEAFVFEVEAGFVAVADDTEADRLVDGGRGELRVGDGAAHHVFSVTAM
ncbi:hypothetical protein HZZ00_37445 (plasmid) [Streptomyces sp. NEAU-sy36]|uniref:hypothetical protein n=1 Tax=Streptomyces sp. NEAU-sy36 TaxID=2751189 RepID=UPI0015D6142E|nr:hypothetical protein [Streptomyces sp. NEAU-sy36]QLJ06722.1 hypothetical protein HZZ00_37445 [Streptomyces sp. NEAU-sy36]